MMGDLNSAPTRDGKHSADGNVIRRTSQGSARGWSWLSVPSETS